MLYSNTIKRQTNENKIKIVECISKIGAIMLNDRDAKYHINSKIIFFF